MKRVLTIQDISCVGKCSITVALPVISAMGVETAIIPTAVLSNHTAFDDFTFKDLTDEITPITDSFKKQKFEFSSIYTGYLGTTEQIELMAGIFNDFRTKTNQIIVDPAMADHGKLYTGFDDTYAKEMAKLCAKADIIIPNITEAAFMTGMEYRDIHDETYLKELMARLSELGAKVSLLTGVTYAPDRIGIAGYDRENNQDFYYENKRIDVNFHGTGDVFSSTIVGALANNLTWQDAVPIAAEYTAKSIQLTLDDPNGRWYGVNFEQGIPYLLERLKQAKNK